MTNLDNERTTKLGNLKHRAEDLIAHTRAYQAALLEARAAGASWPELARAAGCGVGAVRSRLFTAQNGGEFHIQVQGVIAPQIPMPRRED